MIYRRIRNKEDLKGLYQLDFDILTSDFNESEKQIFRNLNNDHESTVWIDGCEGLPIYHYFKEDIWEKYKDILIKVLEGLIANGYKYELIEVDDYKVKKIWYEDSEQLFMQII